MVSVVLQSVAACMHSLVALDIALLVLRLAIGAWATRELIWRKHEPFAAPG
jgi:hypothetical protein